MIYISYTGIKQLLLVLACRNIGLVLGCLRRLVSVKRPIIAQARIVVGNNSATHTNTLIHHYV